jgi:tetratricopeptide (TPR) repeat protein
VLNDCDPSNNPDITIALSKLTEKTSDALLILHAAYQNFPNHENLVYEFAKLLHDEKHFKEALYLYNFLTTKDSHNSNYFGYLGNACLSLNLNDYAMRSYKKAEELSESSESWILANIGNLLKHKGFYSEAIKSLKKSLELNDESEYAHDRLATALKSKEEENEKYANECKEGRKLLRSLEFINEVEI